mgnify:CR=1 FL=1
MICRQLPKDFPSGQSVGDTVVVSALQSAEETVPEFCIFQSIKKISIRKNFNYDNRYLNRHN